MIAGVSLTGPNGEGVGPLTPLPLIPKGTVAKCPSGHSWPVFQGDSSGPTPPSDWEFVRTEDVKRLEIGTGEESRSFDHSASDAESTRTFNLVREIAQTIDVESERTTTLTLGASLSPFDIVSIEASGERALRDLYGISIEARKTVTESIEIPVPARKKVTLHLVWKDIRQVGTAIFRNRNGVEVGVPFNVLVDATWDYRLTDS